MKTMIFKISEQMHRAIKVYAAQCGRTLQDIIEAALKAYIKDNPPKER